MSILVALAQGLADRSLDDVRARLQERGITVSAATGLVDDSDGTGATEPVVASVVEELSSHDAVVVTLRDPRRWSRLFDGFLGADFRMLALADEPAGHDLDLALTDVVVPIAGDGQPELTRVTETLTGGPDLRPDRYEHAMFLAQGQASRSAGLRGGVGCALVDEVGDVIALGTNEVPRAGGGQYWPDSPDDARDVHRGVDPARENQQALARAVLEFAQEHAEDGLGDLDALAAHFVRRLEHGPSHSSVALALESLGRVVHAELAALAAASRHGTGTVGAEAVVTRPPCRQCLRQLIVSGVSKVLFLGHAGVAHYPFHADAITCDGTVPDKVRVAPFTGVTPRGYRKVFGRRNESPLPLGSALLRAAAGKGQVPPSGAPAALLRVLEEWV